MKKNKFKRKTNITPIIIIILVIIVIALSMFAVRISIRNYITYENIKTSNAATITEISNSSIIITNDIVIGSFIDNKWIGVKDIYSAMQSIGSIEINMYGENQIFGTYKTASLRYNAKTNILYTKTTRIPTPEKYIAIKSSNVIRNPKMTVSVPNSKDLKLAKKALGKYRLLNATISISNVYDVYVNPNVAGRIIVVSSKKNKHFGVYSAVIYTEKNTAKIVKYAYVKDLNSSERWPIYSVNFVLDIDADKVSEIVLTETYENKVAYSIMKYIDSKFYEVLKTTINI